jgi:alpha-tubulin suppressor-like RCC1 family protein
MHRRFLGGLVVAAVLARAVVACGGDDSASDLANPEAGTGSVPDSSTPNKPDGASTVVDSGPTGTADADADVAVADADAEAEAPDAEAGSDADATTPDADAGPYTGPFPSGAHLAVGDGTACAIDTTGALKCWGGGKQLTPTVVAPGTTWNEIAAGTSFCGLHTDGTLWCWNPGATPTQPDTGRFFHVTTSDSHSCAIDPYGALYCWGDNSRGELGVGNEDSLTGLQRVGGTSDWASVSAGSYTTCAIKTSGALYCWGSNTWGQVSSGSTFNDVTGPLAVMAGSVFTEVSAGDDDTCARRDDGALFCWGTLGDAQNKPPKRFDTATDWAYTSSHGTHDCSLKTGGALYCFGSNTYGQLGTTTATITTPGQVAPGTTWTDVAAGEWTTCGRKSDGSVWCWGAGMSGQLGLGAPYGPHLSPTQVSGAWKSVSVEGVTVCGVRGDGTIACWGLTINISPTPTNFLSQAPLTIDTGTNWDSAQVASSTLCARQTDTSLWCKANSNPLTAVGLNVASYSHGESHTCAITAAQALYCWGANDQGQLGLPLDAGTTIASPTQIGSATWTSVSVDYSSSCGTRTDGTAWCWGNGNPTMTQVGSATTWTNLSVNSGRAGVNGGGVYTWSTTGSPTQVGSATDWKNVMNGIFFYCATKTDGTLDCWGNNGNGVLGDGTTTAHAAPAQVGSATNWSYTATGNDAVCGLRTDGSLYCWGDNTWAMIGDNSAWVSTPTQILP